MATTRTGGVQPDGSGQSEEIVWRPTPELLASNRLARFMQKHGIGSLDELQARSTADPDWFWNAVVEDLDLQFYEPYSAVVDTSRGIQWARWFVGGTFNYVYNAVDKHLATPRRNKLAIIFEGEEGAIRKLTYRELAVEVNRLAHALCDLGVGKGDRVGIFLPMIPEAAIATLACGKIGALYVPIFSGYAPPAVATRLRDCDAKLLITADGFTRRGNTIPMKETADAAAQDAPTVEHTLVYRRLGRDVPWTAGRDVWWHEAVAGKPTRYETERTDAEDPFMIIYTSGTTGRPKGALHSHDGFPIKATQDLAHCFDLQERDVLFWLTDLGWMMGPWAIVGTLMLGSTLLMYDGTPDYPKPDRLWDLLERHGVTIAGIAPTAIRALMSQGDDWVTRHDLSDLRLLGSTGEPWNPVPWRWYFDVVGGGRCPIINYSGGTEISGGIVSALPLKPQKPCSFSGPVPGIAADVVDEECRPVRGRVGELIIRNPWPGMTRGFWRDPARYEETYWSRWPGVWVHGDWALVDEDGFWYIQGRSDDTIKIAGKRVGPAEVESAAVAHPVVQEAAAIGVPNEIKGEGIVVFAVLRPGHLPSEQLRQEIIDTITAQLGRALKPETVKFVKDIPKTRNAKVMRRVIRAKYLGKDDLGDLTSLDNPQAIEEIGRAI